MHSTADPLNLALLEDPHFIVGALDALRVAKMIGAPLPNALADTLLPLIEIRDLADARVLRIAALASTLVGEGPVGRHIAEMAALEGTAIGSVTTQGGLDRTLATLLVHSGKDTGTVTRFGESVDEAVASCDALAFALLMNYGASLLPNMNAQICDGWLAFLDSMFPASLPFGWLSSEKQNTLFAFDLEIAALSMVLSLAHFRVMDSPRSWLRRYTVDDTAVTDEYHQSFPASRDSSY